MNIRQSRSRAMTDTEEKHDEDTEKGQRGVNGRSIVMLTNSGRVLGQGDGHNSSSTEAESSESSSQGKEESPHIPSEEDAAPLQRNITFAGNLVSPTGRKNPDERSPADELSEKHTAFYERQRDGVDQEILRIPGPREFDQGKTPEVTNKSPIGPDSGKSDHHITVDASNTPARYRGRQNSSGFQFHQSATQRSQASSTGLDRNTTTTRPRRPLGLSAISDVKSFFKRHDTNQPNTTTAPYLSWQPTVGRNSTFVDLTEEQREELGGIEYRSLKLLAVILIGKLDPYAGTTFLVTQN